MESIIKDIRFGLRNLSKNPGFTLIAVFTLALGIGATTAIFSAVNPILFEPLPYPSANRIMTIWYAGADGSRVEQAFGTYRELAQRSQSFDAIVGRVTAAFGEPVKVDRTAEKIQQAGWRVGGSVLTLEYSVMPNGIGNNVTIEFTIRKNGRRATSPDDIA